MGLVGRGRPVDPVGRGPPVDPVGRGPPVDPVGRGPPVGPVGRGRPVGGTLVPSGLVPIAEMNMMIIIIYMYIISYNVC